MTYIRHLILTLISALSFALFSTLANAQNAPVSLVADSIQFTQSTGILIAQGNVKVYFEDSILAAQTIRYTQTTDQIEIIGSYTLKNGDNTTLSGRDTVMDAKLQKGLILGARAIIDQQLQIAAQQLDRIDENTSVFQTVVASTCYVCNHNQTPFWQIRAKRIIHDKKLKKLYFESAILDFLGFPIFYVPKLSIPEPGVARATGFLVPQFSTSNTLGVTAKIPYFIALNDYSDVTITPFLSFKGSAIVEGEYRRRTRNGAYRLNGAFALADQLDNGGISAFIEGQGLFNLKNDYQLEFGLDFANNVDLAAGEKSFKENYNYSNDDRLKSFVQVSKTQKNSYFQLGASFTQSFRYKNFDGDAAGTLEVDPNVPVVLPEFYYRRNFDNSVLGGKLGIAAQSVTLLDSGSGRYSRIGTRFDWQRFWLMDSGLVFGAGAQINANAYLTDGGNFGNVAPVASAELRYPLERTTGNITHVIEPIVQLIWAPDEVFGTLNTDSNTSDSTTAEFEETNLFSINRFPGFDKTEAGLRANVGVQYLLHNPNGWEFSATAGRVYRAKNLGQFDTSISTGLDQLNSDYVGAFTLKFPNKFSLSSRLLIDGSLNTSKNETKLAFKYKKLGMNLGYVWIKEDSVLNNNERQHEASLKASYQIDDNWSFSADWRQNLSTQSPIEGEFGIDYENECAKMEFSLSLEYDEDGNVDREVGLKISLSGLGSNKKQKDLNRRCGF